MVTSPGPASRAAGFLSRDVIKAQPIGSAGRTWRPMRARRGPCRGGAVDPVQPSQSRRRGRWRRRTATIRSTPSPCSSTSSATRTCRYRGAAPGPPDRLRALPAAPIRRDVTAALRVPVGGGASRRGARSVPTVARMRGALGFARGAHSFCKRRVDWSAASPQSGAQSAPPLHGAPVRRGRAPPCAGRRPIRERGTAAARGAAGWPMGGRRLPQYLCAAMRRRC